MKICCIGNIHGTGKFLSCYNDILLREVVFQGVCLEVVDTSLSF